MTPPVDLALLERMRLATTLVDILNVVSVARVVLAAMSPDDPDSASIEQLVRDSAERWEALGDKLLQVTASPAAPETVQ